MPLDPENAAHLKPWLIKTLEPICDAEPNALADYILALLKHSAPEAELRKELLSQLEEFLEKECSPFIDTLFTALRTKSYLPYSAPSPLPASASSTSINTADVGIPIPLDALLTPTESVSPDRGRKRGYDYDEDLRPSKGPRLTDDQYGRYGRQGWDRGERGSRMGIPGRADYMDGGMNGATPANARGPYRPEQRRGICRDYHNNGYCARGAFCKYSHGDDAVIPAQLFPMNGAIGAGQVPFMPMMNGNMQYPISGAPGAAYDPHERIPMSGGSMGMGTGRPHQPRTPMLPRHGEASAAIGQKPGELPHIQDLTPEGTSEDRMMHGQQSVGYDARMAQNAPMTAPGGMMSMSVSQDVEMAGPSAQPGGYQGRPPRGGGGGRGTFGGDAASFRPQRRSGDKTLVVEKIPEDKLSLGAVNDWFKKFGTVTNVAVDAVGGKALVSFSTHEEAHAAWKSEDAVFGNRFVKVFWHRPKEGHGHLGARMLAASAPLVANMAKEPTPAPITAPAPSTEAFTAPVAAPVPSTPARKPSTSAAAAELAAKQLLLEKQIAEQKALMAKLGTASAEEKKEIMARLRKLNEEMKPAPSAATPTKAPSPAPAAATPPAAPSRRASTPRDEEKKKELLDKELELHNAVNGATEGEESTEALQAKLAKLKAEAASLGLSDLAAAAAPAEHAPYRGGYRGRGRGARSYYRGGMAMRGGPPRGSMKLDNRPKKLFVKGVSEGQVQAVKDWYETTGQVDSVDLAEGGVIVSFKSRPAAEQGLAKGTSIATIGSVQVSWYTGGHQTNGSTPAQKTPTPAPAEQSPATSKSAENVAPPSVAPQETSEERPAGAAATTGTQEEEVAARGWGDEDDEFGML